MHRTAARKGLLRPLPPMDLPFLVLVLTLVAFGLVMLCSASSAVALYRRQDAFAYVRPQLLYAAMGLVAMWTASRVDYHIYHKLAWPLLALSLVLLTAVLFMPEYNAASAGLCCRGLAHYSPARSPNLRWCWCLPHHRFESRPHGQLCGGGGALCAGAGGSGGAHVAGAPPFRHGVDFKHRRGAHVRGRHRAAVVHVGRGGRRCRHRHGYRAHAGAGALRRRPSHSWLDPFADPLGDGHQTIQSLYAIGSGGAAGLGLGNSRQKHLFVPEPQNDFIFSILCEELGFLGACAVILLFSALLWRGITLAAYAPDRFGALLVVGFVVQVALQAVLNIAVVTNTIPNTGISLPFFSSGGTSLMMLLGEMGIVLSVSRGES